MAGAAPRRLPRGQSQHPLLHQRPGRCAGAPWGAGHPHCTIAGPTRHAAVPRCASRHHRPGQSAPPGGLGSGLPTRRTALAARRSGTRRPAAPGLAGMDCKIWPSPRGRGPGRALPAVASGAGGRSAQCRLPGLRPRSRPEDLDAGAVVLVYPAERHLSGADPYRYFVRNETRITVQVRRFADWLSAQARESQEWIDRTASVQSGN